jgi:hypothetical protein
VLSGCRLVAEIGLDHAAQLDGQRLAVAVDGLADGEANPASK